jgi:O-antigen ligase
VPYLASARQKFSRISDRKNRQIIHGWLLVAVSASLPWSTSATEAMIGCWVVVAISLLDPQKLWKALESPVAILPLVICLISIAGLIYTEGESRVALHRTFQYFRLLAIPLLLAQCPTRAQCWHVVWAYLLSCSFLLAASYLVWLWPQLSFRPLRVPGVPTKDYIAQSGEFTLCALGLLALAWQRWSGGQRLVSTAAVGLALLFLSNIFCVAASRTALFTLPILLVVLAAKMLRYRIFPVFCLALSLGGAAVWYSSPSLQQRTDQIRQEVYGEATPQTQDISLALRVQFWKVSLSLLREAPILGHGTGSTGATFKRSGQNDTSITPTDNPHNQTLLMAVELGLLGVAALWAMWTVHTYIFIRHGLAASCGLFLVLQNVIGSVFNSHLVDFTQSWTYAFGVGVLSALVWHEAPLVKSASGPQRVGPTN